MLFRTDAAILAAWFGGCMVVAWLVGNHRGRRLALDPNNDPGSKIADATLTLLGLLLAFTFAMTLERHEHRRLAVVAHSSAIGDFYTCATLLPDPERSELQAAIHAYTQHELDALRDYELDAGRRNTIAEANRTHNEMTALVARALARGTPIAINLTNTLNAVTSAHAARTADFEERLPWPVQILLLVTASAAAFLTGRQQGLKSKTCAVGTLSFIVLVSLLAFVIKDLSQPRRGWVKASYGSMTRLIESMTQ